MYVKTHHLLQVVAVDLNHYFLNKEEYCRESRYAANIIYFRTSLNIFSEEKATIKKVLIFHISMYIILLWLIRVLWVSFQTLLDLASNSALHIVFL